MGPEENNHSENKATQGNSQKPLRSNTPESEKKGFGGMLKKIGFKVWLAVMIIGGTLAFIVALFLL